MEARESCIFYADWLEAANTLERPETRCKFYDYVLTYALTGEELDVPGELKLATEIVKKKIDRDGEKWLTIKEKRRAAAVKSHERFANAANAASAADASKSKQVQQKQASAAVNVNVNVSDSVSVEDKSSNLNNPPLPPQGDGEGKDLKGFGIYFNRVQNIQIPPKVEESTYAIQYAWRMAEGCPGFAKAVNQAIDETCGPETFKAAMQQLCQRFKPSTDFGAIKVAMEMRDLDQTSIRAIVSEINRSKSEPEIYETMLGKIKHIKGGAKITNLASFLHNRI